jgi:hypothetical protein
MEPDTLLVDLAEVFGWKNVPTLPPVLAVYVALNELDSEARSGLPRVLALTNRLVSWTDIAAGTARPEAEAYLEPIADQTLTIESWLQMVGELRDGGLLGAVPLE